MKISTRNSIQACSCRMLALVLSLFFVLRAGAAHAEEDRLETSFYAVSSLRFYLDEISSSDRNDDTIAFTDREVEELWRAAASDPSLLPIVHQAREQYSKALESGQHSQLFYDHCSQAQELLRSVWEKQHAQIVKPDHTSSLQEKFRNCTVLTKGYPYFDGNPVINAQMQQEISPYLLPANHPLRESLDKIFSKSTRPLKNESTFTKAGFTALHKRPVTLIIVARHPSLPGYLLKLHLDTESGQKDNLPGWKWFVKRCQGAENVRNLIKKKKLRYFTVPDKWIYPLPTPTQSQLKAGNGSLQPVVLVVTDMQIVSSAKTKLAWKKKITYRHLDELYCILSHGFSSCFLSGNIPYTKNGIFTCIDTEHPKRKLNYSNVKRFLSKKMNRYWDKLVRQGGVIKQGTMAEDTGKKSV